MALGWAHYRCRNILAIATNGANVSTQEMLPMRLHRHIIADDNSTDGHKCSLSFYNELLLMPLDGPIIATEHYC